MLFLEEREKGLRDLRERFYGGEQVVYSPKIGRVLV